MYVTQLKLFGNRSLPLLLTMIYNGIVEIYDLPPIETLVASLKTTVAWPASIQDGLETYYLEDLIEGEKPKDVFELRLKYSKDARDKITIFLSIEANQVQNITVSFPGRSGRGSFSRILGCIKLALKAMNIRSDQLQLHVEGFYETGMADYVQERSLSAFVYIEPIDRYLHVKENHSQVHEVRRGHRSLDTK